MALLDVKGVTKRFGGLTAVDDVDLQVNDGKVHSIIGPNGAGKSTLLNLLMGSDEPDSGSITFDGQPIAGRPGYEINQLGIARVFQSPEIYPDLSLLDNVLIAAFAARDGSFKLRKLFEHPRQAAEAREVAEQALADVGLERHRHADAVNLSRGDKRRLEIAICLAQKPRLLLLDEPTAGMSQRETHSTIDLLHTLAEKGMTKIIIEHDMKVVFALSDEITVLHQGAVIAHGTPDEVRGNDRVQEAYLGGVEL